MDNQRSKLLEMLFEAQGSLTARKQNRSDLRTEISAQLQLVQNQIELARKLLERKQYKRAEELIKQISKHDESIARLEKIATKFDREVLNER